MRRHWTKVFLILVVVPYSATAQSSTESGEQSATQSAQSAPKKKEAKPIGRMSVRGMYSVDDEPSDQTPDVGLAFLRLDLRVKDLTESETELRADGTFPYDFLEANERRFGLIETKIQIRRLHFIEPFPSKKLKLGVGRFLVSESGNAWVDGVHGRLKLNRHIHVGLVGGLRPDPIDYRLDSSSQTVATYFMGRWKSFRMDGADNLALRGEADRQFLFQRMHWRIRKNLFFSSYLIFDFADEPQVTTLLATTVYRPQRFLRLDLNYSRYALEPFRRQVIYRNVIEPNQALRLGDEVINLLYNRIRFSVAIRFWKRFYQYQTVEYKHRSQDDLEAWHYTIGLRNYDVLRTGTLMDIRTTIKNNFQSDSWLIAFDARHDLSKRVSMNARFTLFDGRSIDRFTEQGRTFDEAQQVVLIGGGVYWRLSRHHRIDGTYDGVYEADIQDARNQNSIFIHTVMARYNWLFGKNNGRGTVRRIRTEPVRAADVAPRPTAKAGGD